ncbi:family 20 glycosylhydrolase [Puerhibacterium puerhi]|uniref:family 20 glycosylhydrolase n=1 Tax=Puerhibacterium puerhi TaxID=2692623 RepID=UPI00135CA06B|nr:family 20 glycosylhydrolase [Puerhibacterium puerhi]
MTAPGVLPLVPWPTAVERRDAPPLAVAAVRVTGDDVPAALVAELLEPVGVTVLAATGAGADAVTLDLRLDPAAGPAGADSPERYTLAVGPERVEARAAEPVGLLHAVRTLRQLVTRPALDAGTAAVTGAAPTVPAVVVHDAPRYAWRGLSFDVVRHWFGPADVRAVVDLAGAYKLRVLHLHLTDDQGWRIEIPSRPALTERSGGTQVGGAVPAGQRGYLTVEEYRDLQAYAAARHVTIVPEVDLPGHTNAATHAYGELTPDGAPTDAYGGTEVGFSRLWADVPATEPFLRDVLGDLARMTDGPWLHVGGDEAPKVEPAEYAAIMELAQRIVREHGKTPVAWQEAARAAVEPGTVLQFWDPHVDDAAAAVFARAAEAGARFVASPGSRAYLDMKYAPGHPLGLEWAGHVEVRDAYDWDPATAVPGVPADAVVGVAGAVWTETLTTRDELFSMLLPRLPALAEAGWSAAEARDWEAFAARLAGQAPVWRALGWAFHPSPQVPW